MKRFREVKRQHFAERIQRENRYIHERLQNTKPYYSTVAFQKSFEIHNRLKLCM